MEQNRYKWELIELLRKGEGHQRALGRQIGVNHMTVSRTLRALQQENIADCRREGKNTVYLLKDSAEAKIAVRMCEYAKLTHTIHRYPRLRRIIEELAHNPTISLAVLFGSYAKGIATASSDIDLFIATKDRTVKENMRQLDSKLSIKIGQLSARDPLSREIAENHIILKGVDAYYDRAELSP